MPADRDANLTWSARRSACTEVGYGASMATVQADGRPHVAWVGIGFDDVERLWTVHDPAEVRDLWTRQVLPYDQAEFFGSPDNPELLHIDLTPTRATVHDGDPASPPAVRRRRS